MRVRWSEMFAQRPKWLVVLSLGCLLLGAGRCLPGMVDESGVRLYETVAPESRPRDESPAISGEATGNAEWEKAVTAFAQGRFGDCFEILTAMAQQDSTLPPARLMLARLHLAAGQLAPGRAVLEQAAAEAPDYPGIHLTFGQLAVAEGRVTDALLHFEKASSLGQAADLRETTKQYVAAQASAGRAAVAEARQDWETARIHLLSVLEHDPHNGHARQRLGRALFLSSKPRESYEQIEQAVKDDATLEPAAVSMARLNMQQGNSQKAEEWLQFGVKKNPGDIRVRSAYASWLLDHGRLDESAEQATAAATSDPGSNEVKLLLAECARHAKDFPKAEQYFEAVHGAEPGNFLASNGLALALVEQQDETKRGRALELAEVNVRQYPQRVEALSTLGWVHYRTGRLESAEQLLTKAVSGGTVTSDTAYFLACCLADRGRPEDARKLLARAVESAGRFAYRAEARNWLDSNTAHPAKNTQAEGDR